MSASDAWPAIHAAYLDRLTEDLIQAEHWWREEQQQEDQERDSRRRWEEHWQTEYAAGRVP